MKRAAQLLLAPWFLVSGTDATPAAADLEWVQGPGYRSAALPVPKSGLVGFTLLPPMVTGVDFTNTLSDAHAAENQIRLNGSGVALGDVDGDGWCDIFVGALEGRVALYRGLGAWRFTNATANAGLDFPARFSTGATFADVDGDGDLDLLLNGIGTGTRLFLNDGHGHFTASAEAGLGQPSGAMTSALADIDGDGTLDLYVANYRTNTVRSTGFALLNVAGRRMVPPNERGHLELTPSGLVLEHGEPHQLYRNDGRGHFHPVPWTDGTFRDEEGHALGQAPWDWGLTAAFRDLDGDGAPDLYVCNDFHSPDRVWLNDGHGRFRAFPQLALRHTATFSMAVDFADLDRDGRDDILVSDMTSRQHGRRLMQIAGMAPYAIRPGVFDDRPQLDRTVLQWNRGDGTYAEIAHYAGLENSEWNWSVLFLDVDLDGFEDVLAATGHLFDSQDLDAQARIAAHGPYPRDLIPKKLLMLPPLAQAKLAFRNQGDLTFTECGQAWGFDQTGVAHGMALADLDNDGDLDLVVNNLNSHLGLYRNDSAAPRIAVRLRGQPPNTAGTGARLTVTGGPVPQSQEMMCGGRYLSSDDARRVFAAGTITNVLRLEVAWRSGQISTVTNALPNRLYEIAEPTASLPAATHATTATPARRLLAGPDAGSSASGTGPFFADASDLLNHTHHDDLFDDFAIQPLLPKRLSQLGPGVTWCDLDADGHDDLLIGSGKGGELALFHNDGHGGFTRVHEPPWTQPVACDQTTLLAWPRPHGPARVLVGMANYECGSGPGAGASVCLYDAETRQVTDLVPGTEASVGPLALADYEGEGNLGLFVGGRCVPGRYPEPARSQVWHQRAGQWTLDTTNAARLRHVGLVSGAVWSDLDGDGWPELVLAREWGPLAILRNDHGQLQPWNPPLVWPEPASATSSANSSPVRRPSPAASRPARLSDLSGWWHGVATGDFDGDGRLDIVVSNWGLNTKYRAAPDWPQRLYYADFDGNGTLDLIETCLDQATGKEVPQRDRDALASALPFIGERFPTQAAYGQATVSEILGPQLASAQRCEVNTLASMLFLNRGEHLVAVPLPREAQFAPAFGVCVGDFDGDGCEDVFLSQNFFATEPKTPRCDAGRGLWLRGNGQGGLAPVPGQVSGVQVYGEQRGCALADYDADGRLDLVVTQNGNATRLYHNVGARPGLRVRLVGPPGNLAGIGAVLRLGDRERLGAAREVHAGSGYWSGDSPVQVLSFAGKATRLQVRWPGGRLVTQDLPPGVREVQVKWTGTAGITP
jgi:hypothetical protein